MSRWSLLSGWRGLGLFWAVVLGAMGGAAGTLAWLGPLPIAATAPAPPPVALESAPAHGQVISFDLKITLLTQPGHQFRPLRWRE